MGKSDTPGSRSARNYWRDMRGPKVTADKPNIRLKIVYERSRAEFMREPPDSSTASPEFVSDNLSTVLGRNDDGISKSIPRSVIAVSGDGGIAPANSIYL